MNIDDSFSGDFMFNKTDYRCDIKRVWDHLFVI